MTVPATVQTTAESLRNYLKDLGGWGVALVLVAVLVFQQNQTATANQTRDNAIAQLLERQAANQLAMTEKLVLMSAKLEQVSTTLTTINAEIRVTQNLIRGETKPR
jgi:anti-sigma-K factor RskA